MWKRPIGTIPFSAQWSASGNAWTGGCPETPRGESRLLHGIYLLAHEKISLALEHSCPYTGPYYMFRRQGISHGKASLNCGVERL